jgi:hypothetical protein
MSDRTLKEKLDLLMAIKTVILQDGEKLQACIAKTCHDNPWFTPDNIRMMLSAITSEYLHPDKIEKWIAPYKFASNPRKVGIIMAGNIPLVGFHDFMSVFISGHIPVIKLSSKDPYLLPFLIREAQSIAGLSEQKIIFVNHLKDIEAIIATGSDNSSRYFEYYFGHMPHIVRKNRTSIGVIKGNETQTELKSLGRDVFSYFGMGCRSVSALRIPKDYDIDHIFRAWVDYGRVNDHHKYRNNFEYNYSVFILNNEPFLTNNFVMLKEDTALHPPLSVLFFSRYNSENELHQQLESARSQIQCLVSSKPFGHWNHVPFGKAQQPELGDYADNIDTLSFLESLNG